MSNKESWLQRKYREFYERNSHYPKIFEPYNCRELADYAPTLTANSMTSPTYAGTVLIIETKQDENSQ